MIIAISRPRLVAVLGAAVLAASLVAVPASATSSGALASASSASASELAPKIKGKACTTKRGVTVVVDLRDLENAKGKRLNLVKIGCAPGSQESGITAIQDAGFKLEHSGGFVCRLDGKPLPQQTDCVSEGYWSYWHGARDGADWEYSGVGAGGWAPPPGSLEGWAWNWYDEPATDPRVEPSDLYPPAAG